MSIKFYSLWQIKSIEYGSDGWNMIDGFDTTGKIVIKDTRHIVSELSIVKSDPLKQPSFS